MEEDFNLHVKMSGLDEAEKGLKRLTDAVADATTAGEVRANAEGLRGDEQSRRNVGDVSAARDVADASRRVVESFASLGDTGRRVTTTFSNLATLFRGTNFARALGIRPVAPGGPDGTANAESFARTLSRVMASRAVMGAMNVGFEYAKNPLHDNFEINRAQKSINSAVTTLATTGSPLAAAISGLTSWLQSNVEKRNQLHTQEYGVQQQLISNQRQVEERGGDWAFGKIQNMLSRPEQIRNLRLRANQIRGIASIDESYIPESMRETGEDEEEKKGGKDEVRDHSSPVGDAAAKVKAEVSASYRDPDTGKIVALTPKAEDGKVAAYASAAKELADEGEEPPQPQKPKVEQQASGEKEAQPASAPVEAAEPSREEWLAERRRRYDKILADRAAGRSDLTDEMDFERTYGTEEYEGQWRIEERRERIDRLNRSLEKMREPVAEAQAPSPGDLMGAAVEPNAEKVAYNYKIRFLSAMPSADSPEMRYYTRMAEVAKANPPAEETPKPETPVEGAGEASNDAAAENAEAKTDKPAAADRSSRIEERYKASQDAVLARYADVSKKSILDFYGHPDTYNWSVAARQTEEAMEREMPGLDVKSHEIRVGDVEWAKEKGKLQGNNADIGARGIIDAAYAERNKALAEERERFIAGEIEKIKSGEFKDIDVKSLEWIRDNTPDNEKDSEWFRNVNKLYVSQTRRAAELDLQADMLQNDPSQILGQYTEASRVTDSMARQGFFIGSQVDVQDVNKDILAEMRKILPKLDEMAKKQVSYSGIGFQANTNFD